MTTKSKLSREKSHKEQIERWAKFVKNNPNKWKSEHTKFINAQIDKANKFYKTLDIKTVKKLKGIKQ